MNDVGRPAVRVLTGSVADRRSRATEETASVIGEELRKVGFTVKRHVVVKGDSEHIRALMNNVAVDNEADAIVLVGGCGFGPNDHAVDTVANVCEQHIEGFGEAYRRLLRSDVGVHAMLTRAAAGVHDRVVVFALGGRLEDVRLAVEVLIAPVLPEVVELANGRPPPVRAG